MVENGFRGKIYCSEATFDLCKILLPDSGFLHEEDANRANRYNYRKHIPVLPLYTEKMAEESLKYFYPIDFDKLLNLDQDINFKLIYSGHIIGSSFIKLTINNKIITFSGDLGRVNGTIMRPPEIIENTDYLLIESTYGDRLRTAPIC